MVIAFFVLYAKTKRKEKSFSCACIHHLNDLSRLLFDLPASEAFWELFMFFFISIFDLGPDLGMLPYFIGFHALIPQTNKQTNKQTNTKAQMPPVARIFKIASRFMARIKDVDNLHIFLLSQWDILIMDPSVSRAQRYFKHVGQFML